VRFLQPLLAAATVLIPLLFAAAASRPGRRLGARDRRGLMSSAADAVLTLALTRALIDWVAVPVAIWGLGAAITAWAAISAVRAWPSLAPSAAGGSWRHISWAMLGLKLFLVALLLVVLAR
jgi:hypothetical protein